MKVYALPAEEGWICDQLVEDWKKHSGMACDDPREADVIWLLSDWRWQSVSANLLATKKVVTTVHHIVPEKFDRSARMDFAARDDITDLYHVYNQHTLDFIRPLTKKPICLVPYWANGEIWKKTNSDVELRRQYGLPEDAYLVGSFQRDTEGHDLKSPKLEKGPDLLADAMIAYHKKTNNSHIVLGGWRRQYVIGRLEAAGVPFTYFERPPQITLNDLYQTLDLYMVTARHEGGPQALIECGLLGVPVVSRSVGIAEQVLPDFAIADDVTQATPCIPYVESMKLPLGMDPYKKMFEGLK
jgi:glycosyltransferase involved in cell wall biosynthesis